MSGSAAGESGVLDAVRTALRSQPGVDLARNPLTLRFDGGVLTLGGEVPNVAVKKRITACAVRVPDVGLVVDNVRVKPTHDSGDGTIRHQVRDALVGEPALGECGVALRVGERRDVVRPPSAADGCRIEMGVEEGVVQLKGTVPSLSHKRIAGVLAWWVPGSRDVVNELTVEPPEEDRDDEVTDAVRMVLEKDPFVNAAQVVVSCHDYVVTLSGLVSGAGEREMAEYDAWYVYGVDDVVNRIEVRA